MRAEGMNRAGDLQDWQRCVEGMNRASDLQEWQRCVEGESGE